jgi:hypothetical protein
MFPLVLPDYLSFKQKDTKNRFPIPLLAAMPVLFENTPFTRFDTHYIYHTAWAARKVKEIDPDFHVDISSSLYFSSIVSAFKTVKFYDYRPAKLNLSGLSSSSANLSKLHFEDNSVQSISCMHTVEHIGLGRYGDPIEPEGDIRAAHEGRGGQTTRATSQSGGRRLGRLRPTGTEPQCGRSTLGQFAEPTRWCPR